MRPVECAACGNQVRCEKFSPAHTSVQWTAEAAPFHAVPVHPGDIGTKGGPVTDAAARVLRADGSVIEGLYATGNASAAVMGETYPGPGATIGPAMTFSWIAVNDIAGALGLR
ncbi:FAD-binding protein [Streptomyces niger]|uniref:FAD-binding protein n=1 Tax=Streptomyces niger TaxID=66373 RepID=UPI00069C0F02|nr:FAD-binding protein [Streptomyces niger]